MRTQYVATVPLDDERLSADLGRAAEFRYSEAYSNYLIGGPWKSCMLWARGGDGGDGVLTNYSYEQEPAFTEQGRELPYLQEIITKVADLGRLNFARLAVFSDSVIVPHRDYLELAEIPEGARSAHRVHIPLVTHDACFFSEHNVVYRMRKGEVWFFDASRIHSVASFSKEPRIHLILDLVDVPAPGPLVKVGEASDEERIPPGRLVARPALPEGEREALRRLADVLTMDSFNEVFSIVIKKHFRFDGGDDFAWRTMTELARECADPAVLPRTEELRRYFELERAADR
ncbi:aspartyl/asparaginyl beta-hydroxylase domain-containing protein [Amycolatopsis sacchari]|uniref:aspartyl/asparaginyl beta-hydroxylase domain-containing protein n=1 Tax=Amycolatopsis sacchari TaxID=115433 RepID=UPI003D762072